MISSHQIGGNRNVNTIDKPRSKIVRNSFLLPFVASQATNCNKKTLFLATFKSVLD